MEEEQEEEESSEEEEDRYLKTGSWPSATPESHTTSSERCLID